MATVFLDLDGTLTDAGEGILNSVDYALRKLSPVSYTHLRAHET